MGDDGTAVGVQFKFLACHWVTSDGQVVKNNCRARENILQNSLSMQLKATSVKSIEWDNTPGIFLFKSGELSSSFSNVGRNFLERLSSRLGRILQT